MSNLVNDFIVRNRMVHTGNSAFYAQCPRLTCRDGFSMSVQASPTHYSTPRDIVDEYSAVEIGYPSHEEELILEWAEDSENPTGTVYAWVPVEVVEQVILNHGGLSEN